MNIFNKSIFIYQMLYSKKIDQLTKLRLLYIKDYFKLI